MKKPAIVLVFSALVSLGALAQNLQQGINDLYAERFQSAKATFEKLLATNPNNIEANYWLGQIYIADGNINAAKGVYDKALAASNNAPLILVGEGHVELLQGKAADARQHFETAINASKGRKGNDPNILNAVGKAIVESYSEKDNKTDLDYAIAKLNEASQLAPTNPDIWLNLGNAYRKKRDGGNAVQAYTKAGNFAPALYQIARVYETQKTLRDPSGWETVLDYLNKAIAADPRFVPAYNELYIYNLYAKHDFPTAETYANKIVSNSDPSPEIKYTVAQTLFVQGKYPEAINTAKEIINQTNGNPRPRVYRLLTYSYMGNKDTATACQYATQFFEKEKNEDNIVAGDYLMHAQACGKNNPDVILADIDKARTKDPEQAARVLREALDDAKKAGDQTLVGQLSLILYAMQGKNANPQNLISIGVSFAQGGQLSKADSLFNAYTKTYPDSIYGYYWSGRLHAQVDSTMAQGLAVADYDQVLRVALMDPTRSTYKTLGVSAAGYLAGYYNNIKADKATALSYVQKGLILDPENPNLKQYQSVLSKQQPTQQKTSTSNNAAKTETKTKTGDTKTKVKKDN